MLWRALKHVSKGSYIDIGAWDPIQDSISKGFYDLGWRGINIEPTSAYARKLKKYRPDEKIIEKAVSNINGTMHIYEILETGLSTLNEEIAMQHTTTGRQTISKYIETIKLTAENIDLEEEIHWMKIDVEGHEFEVLDGWDHRAIRPWIIVIESVNPITLQRNDLKWKHLLVNADYQFVYFDGINDFYLNKSHPELLIHFESPINLFDDYITNKENELHAKYIQLQNQHDLFMMATTSNIVLVQNLQLYKSFRLYLAKHPFLFRVLKPIWSNLRIKRMLKKMLKSDFTKIILFLLQRNFTDDKLSTKKNYFFKAKLKTSKHTPRTFRRNAKSRRKARERLIRKYLNFQKIESPLKNWDEKLLDLVKGNSENWERFNHDLEIEAVLKGDLSNINDSFRIDKIIVDARCLSYPAFAKRGIGVYARSVISGLIKHHSDLELVIIGNPEDHDEFVRQYFRIISPQLVELSEYVSSSIWFIQLSPMTSNVYPIAGILHAANIQKSTIVYDFIPFDFPDIYLRDKRSLIDYFVRLKALEYYNEFCFISESTMQEFQSLIPTSGKNVVLWPNITWDSTRSKFEQSNFFSRKKRLTILSGDDPRKNIIGALKLAEFAVKLDLVSEVIIIGFSSNQNYVKSLISKLHCDHEKFLVCGYLTGEEFDEVLNETLVSLVCSFAEGLSLPVIESIQRGVPTVVSNIPAHLEIVGNGPWAGDPNNEAEMKQALSSTLSNPHSTLMSQIEFFKNHKHQGIESYISSKLHNNLNLSKLHNPRKGNLSKKTQMNVAIATPLPPLRTGIADHSFFWIEELAKIANVTVLSHKKVNVPVGTELRRLDSTEWLNNRHDARINVIGNSHFHLQNIHLIPAPKTLVIAHDVRMIELVDSTQMNSPKPTLRNIQKNYEDSNKRHPLDYEDDLKLGIISKFSSNVIFHSRKSALRAEKEYGINAFYLPLIPYRFPQTGETWQEKHWQDDFSEPNRKIKIGFFGAADINTKSIDSIIESINWLIDWRMKVELKIVGNMDPMVELKLKELFTSKELNNVTITGFVSENLYKKELASIDLAVELRPANLLGLSGSLADLVAFGVPTVVSEGLKEQMELPSYCYSVGNDYSPLLVALKIKEISQMLSTLSKSVDLQEERKYWISERQPEKYATEILRILAGMHY
jgi:FkbM family methyltransferase